MLPGWFRDPGFSLPRRTFLVHKRRWWKSVWATCPCHVARLVTEFLQVYSIERGRGSDEEIFSSFRIQLSRAIPVPSYRSPETSGQVAEVSDETPPSKKRFRRAGTFAVLLTCGGTTSSVTCGCRKSDDHPAGSYPGSRGQIQARERIAELNAALMTPLTYISG